MSTFVEPPPPYAAASIRPPGRAGFTSLSPALILRILLEFGDRRYGEEEYMRRLWKLHRDVRRVCRSMYTASTSILRSHYLSTYLTHIRPPYTSDPFPSASNESANVFSSRKRETAVFDRFIAEQIGNDLRRSESELYLEGDEEYDLFMRLQPQARLEDLLFTRGQRQGLLSSTPAALTPDIRPPIPFHAISIKFSSRSVGLFIKMLDGRQRKLVEVSRSKEVMLEMTADDLVVGLREALR